MPEITVSMPYRVQRIEEFLKQLESGDLKLRVRVLESVRAAKKAMILLMATMYTVLGAILLNMGITFSSQGSEMVANGSFVAAGVFLTLLVVKFLEDQTESSETGSGPGPLSVMSSPSGVSRTII